MSIRKTNPGTEFQSVNACFQFHLTGNFLESVISSGKSKDNLASMIFGKLTKAVNAYPGVEVSSDHNLLIAKFQLQLKSYNINKVNIQKLESEKKKKYWTTTSTLT